MFNTSQPPLVHGRSLNTHYNMGTEAVAGSFETRHFSRIAMKLDYISSTLLEFWTFCLYSCANCFMQTTDEFPNMIEPYFYGPLWGLVTLVCLPIGVLGYLLWISSCTFFRQQPYSTFTVTNPKGDPVSRKTEFTLVSANVLLIDEPFARLNNQKNGLARAQRIAFQMLDQSSICSSIDDRRDIIQTKFPDTDILCLQEVWQRPYAEILVNMLKTKYDYFIFDVGESKWSVNFCLMGSGLFIASKYPITHIRFDPFKQRTSYAKYFSYGALCLKVQIGPDVGYVANFHGQAIQGKEPILYHQLSQTQEMLRQFKSKTSQENERIVFDVLAGDFNFDNMSPGDGAMQQHPLLSEYIDVCARRPGIDKPWAVGTEFRQQRMKDAQVLTPPGLRDVLLDDIVRRHYIIDADVEEQTMDLFTCPPKGDSAGRILAVPYGGMRRIDRLLLHRDSDAFCKGYAFITALAGLTDHIPVAFTLRKPQTRP